MNRIAFIISLPTALLLMTSFAAAAEPAPADKGAASGLRPAAIRNPQSAIHNWAASPPAATAPAAAPLRVALVCLGSQSWAGDPNAATSAGAFGRAMKANAAALPARIGGHSVNYDVLPLGAGKGGLDGYQVVVLLPEWTLMLPALDACAKALAGYIEAGGGLVVFQPNPLAVYPPDAKCPPALAERGINSNYCTPGLLPLPATFYGGYEQWESVRNVAGKGHPITNGLTDEQMPYPADQLFSIDRRYTVLARGAGSGSPSLAAASWGRGRIVLVADNVFGTTAARRQAPATVVARSLLWASGATDELVRTASAAAPELPAVAVTTEPADEDGEGPAARAVPEGPDEAGTYQAEESRSSAPATGRDSPAETDNAASIEPGAAAQSAPLGGPRPAGGVGSIVPPVPPPAQEPAPAGPWGPLRGGVGAILAGTLKNARKGDVIRLQAGVYDVGSLVIPDGVSLIGAGAVNTVLRITCPQPMGAGLELQGESLVEDMTIISAPKQRGYMVRAAGQTARPTVRRCILLPGDNEFCAFVAWQKAAPTLTHCIIVSPVGEYGVFARDQAAPVIEYCTIISRGFGIGMMDGSTPTIRRCIVAGQCPGVLIAADSAPAVTDCVLWCRGQSATYPFPITRWTTAKDPDARDGLKTTVDPVKDITCQRDILVQDPKLRMGSGLAGYLAPAETGDAAGYGAYADSPAWPKPAASAPQVKLPDLTGYLAPATRPAAR